ncbi:MAG: NAD(P)/FAD-dependent oxidoreductase [Marmoricola sp.]
MTGGVRPPEEISWWLESCGDDLSPRPPVHGDIDVDVAIVGAGLTGLWTAYYLAKADPGLRIAILEREFAGFGASGRNGGWLSALFPASRDKLAALRGSSRDAAGRLTAAMRGSIDEVARVCTAEGIDCDLHKGGTVSFARTPAQLARARAEVESARAWGDTEDDIRLLGATEAASMARVTELLGATYTPHCARIHPGKLVRGLARVVEGLGVAIHEQTAARSLHPGRVVTDRGVVRAERVLRATEGYTCGLDGMRRAMIPAYSLIVATEPLDASTWERIGMADSPTFSDFRHLLIYGQRSADGRFVFGGRGAPYHYGSSIRPSYDREEKVFAALRRTLVELFPALDGARFTHSWGGTLGIPRDWTASVWLDPRTGIGAAGGYVGDGVTTTNLAGRTLADLVTGTDSALTTLPWVGHRSPAWEPEPMRWLGVNAGLQTMALADHEEKITRRPSLLARAMAPLVGSHQ